MVEYFDKEKYITRFQGLFGYGNTGGDFTMSNMNRGKRKEMIGTIVEGITHNGITHNALTREEIFTSVLTLTLRADTMDILVLRTSLGEFAEDNETVKALLADPRLQEKEDDTNPTEA